jgi:hypothetical protein
MAYINTEAFKQKLIEKGFFPAIVQRALEETPREDAVAVVRCKECGFCKEEVKWNGRKYLGCHFSNGEIREVEAMHFCSYGERKEDCTSKQKVTCLNCKHLMFSDCYGECKKKLRIVNPSDTCEYAEPKERGGNNGTIY